MVKAKKRSKKKKPARSHHASWKGQLRCGLVTFGVQAFNAAAPERGEFHFHQLHVGCHRRIHYQKVCPVHGEVNQEEIVSGFEYARDKYVEIDPEELNSLRTEGERALTIDAFIEPESLDPLYYDGRAYYLLPDGDAASEAYSVLQQAMHRLGADGFGKVLFSGRNQLVRLRAVDAALVMQMVHYSAERKKPDEWAKKLRHGRPAAQNVKLAEELVRSMTTDDLDFDAYEDDYRQRVKELIDAKREGREIVAPEEPATPEVVNLLDALRKSLARGQNRPSKARDGGKSKRATDKRRVASGRRRAS